MTIVTYAVSQRFITLPGHGSDGGAFAGSDCRLLPRQRSSPCWWSAGLHSTPAGRACPRLFGEVQKGAYHIPLLCGASGKIRKFSTWGIKLAKFIMLLFASEKIVVCIDPYFAMSQKTRISVLHISIDTSKISQFLNTLR